jgi:hypothetical protein
MPTLFLTFLTSRFTQLTVRGLTLLFVYLFGADAAGTPDAAAAISQGASWLLLAIAGLATDLVIHSAVWGRVKAWWTAYRALPLVLAAALIPLAAASCTATHPTRQWAQLQTERDDAAVAVLDLHANGLLSDADLVEAADLLDAAQGAIDDYKAAVARGGAGAPAAQNALTLFDAVKRRLARWLLQHQPAKQGAPDERPAGPRLDPSRGAGAVDRPVPARASRREWATAGRRGSPDRRAA